MPPPNPTRKLLLFFFPLLLPLAVRWAGRQEQRILAEGIPLSAEGQALARRMGVQFPEKIRLLQVGTVPLPATPLLKKAGQWTGLFSPTLAGLTLRYGIYLRADCWGHQDLIAHECVHTGQYERLGGFAPFLKQYLKECIELGYPTAPLEQEAILTSARFLSELLPRKDQLSSS